jgi:hypothetical protein
MNTMPVAYLDLVHLEFKDGRIWEIDIKTELEKGNPESIADILLHTLKEYKEEITKIDFKVNVERLKHDIQNSTNNIF